MIDEKKNFIHVYIPKSGWISMNTYYYFTIYIFIVLIVVMHYTLYNNMTSSHVGETWFITYGGPSSNYHDAVNRLTREVNDIQVVDYIIGYTDMDLKNDHEFWNQHGILCENTTWHRGGYGYWIWKPYLIMKTMERMKENDILLYADAGCCIKIADDYNTAHQDMKRLVGLCNKKEILFTSSLCIEKEYSKMDLIKYLEMDTEEVMNSIQYQAGILLIKKTKRMYRFVKEWYKIMCYNYNFMDGSRSRKYRELAEFKESRNDQSIFSLLAKKYGIDNSHILMEAEYLPIVICRRRGG